MLRRIFTARRFHELWKRGTLALNPVNKIQVIGVSPTILPCHPSCPIRTGIPLLQENVDLDKWKSILRSQSSTQDDAEDQEVSDEDEIPEGHLLNNLVAAQELVAMWRLAGKMVPKEMSDEELQSFADITTKSARKKYLKYLAIREGHKRVRKEKQQQKKAAREALLEQTRDPDSEGEPKEYRNTFTYSSWYRSLNKLLGWRTIQAMLFDQPLVFDMSYESNMSRQEIKNTVTQLLEVEGWNRRAKEPYHLHFCNLQQDGAYMKELLKRYGAETWNNLLITNTERHAVDMFSRDHLVYLTADSPNVLRTFDPSKIYIIGALVDRSILSGLSLANAKRLKLATARLPLNEFLHWELGAKTLTLDQMMRIMLSLKETGKWEEALEFVPKRKHDGFHQKQQINNRRLEQNGDQFLKPTATQSKKTVTYKSKRESGLTDVVKMSGRPQNRETKPAATRVRTSLKSSLEGRHESKSRMWWED
ncbi:tRNA methyltransferase 10 homolog C [Corythoichthys intestinalis]|uniref:tRNA methyltransferase 10 homolog C n=1 Tax=Corythoichthys intestinalis TaxID=161448 RepID=UPI0025A5FED7|nr:tRNA methyltransferase 10 homolog C [Corythoichthys intestinalis]